jgi:hypothetical protein
MKLTIGLSSWIIQDGNFPEIEVGSEHRMALEFYAKDGLSPAQGAKSFRHVQGVNYEIVAEVIGIFEEAWVLDCGIRLLRDNDAPQGTRLGDVVAGRVYVGVDPFLYLEQLSNAPGALDLWYTVRVDSIHLNVTPRSRSILPSGQELWSRDESADARLKEIAVTDSWADDDGSGDYLLDVTILSGPGV